MARVRGGQDDDRIIPGDLSGGVVVIEGDFSDGSESDIIVGGLGDDTIESAGADDLVYGDLDIAQSKRISAGKDDIKGDDDDDTLVGDSAELKAGAKGGNDTIEGGDGDDRIHGDAATLMKGATGGDDELSGNDGADIIIGDAVRIKGGKGGNDTIQGGADDDQLYGDAGPLGDELGLLDKKAVGGDDELNGGDGNDVLYGDAVIYSAKAKGGDDKLDGGDDDDILDGGRGDDELTGGDGNDIFIIGLKSGDDVITDFDDNDDLLDLSALFAISGKTEEEIFGNDDRLDEDDDFVSDSSDGLEIDIGQLFGTADKGVDTLLIEGVSNINLDQVITTSSVA